MTISEKAAQMWADKIQGSVHDAGDDNCNLALMFATAFTSPASPLEIERFKEILTKRIEIGITGKHKQYRISSDYDPDAYLAEICDAAGINTRLVPVKSFMTVYPDRIEYKFGYGSPIDTITLDELTK